MKLISIDLFSGCGGLTEGMRQADFYTKIALELDKTASTVYKLNHKTSILITEDIRNVTTAEVKKYLQKSPIHLLAGCPPCQGFSSIRRLNKEHPAKDQRNLLIMEYVRFVKELKPYTIMLENVPGLVKYDLFNKAVNILKNELGYNIDYQIVNVKDYGVPQSRKRLVLVGSRIGLINVAPPTHERVTVRDVIGNMPPPELSDDFLHRKVAKHTPAIRRRIELTPKDGGSRKDISEEFTLKCHQNKNVGFQDVYGRLRWDSHSTTITGGCLNPSKGRFLHPEQNRALSVREATLLQSFPKNYIFPEDIAKDRLGLMIGNALPPKFSYYQSINIKNHLLTYLK